MKVSLEVFRKAPENGMTRRLTGLVPLGCLLLTCCMGETVAVARQDAESGARPAALATAAPQQIQPQPAAQSADGPQASPQVNQDTVDAVQEGRLLLAEKSSKLDAKKSKSAPAAKQLDASQEAEEEEGEEEEEDEEADEEETTGKGSSKAGTGAGFRGKSITSDFDPALRADLIEATVRGSVLTVAVSLTFRGTKDRNEIAVKELGYCGSSYSWVTDYESGNTFGCASASGFSRGQIKSGETKTLRLTFPAPKGAKTVGITLYNLGTFDDVRLGAPGGGLSGQRTGSSKTEEAEEEEAEEEEDIEEDSKGLAGKKRAKKGAK